MPEPHGFAVRFSVGHLARRACLRENLPCKQRFALDTARVHRIPSRVRDDVRSAPLAGSGRRESATDLGVRESNIFLRGRLDDPNQPEICSINSRYAQRDWESFRGWGWLEIVPLAWRGVGGSLDGLAIARLGA